MSDQDLNTVFHGPRDLSTLPVFPNLLDFGAALGLFLAFEILADPIFSSFKSQLTPKSSNILVSHSAFAYQTGVPGSAGQTDP